MRSLLFFLLTVQIMPAFAQQENIEKADYPQDYFRNPLDIPIFLAGNFGECRPGHFHSGVDIKTLGKENQPVHAAADGYISRIKMDKGGFGHALYITHANGYTTLYAHLNDFSAPIQKYLKKEQYEKRHWDVDVQINATQFPVKKGQQIAWSGNTGASTAPHLHFEIRNTATEHPLNPELFGLPIVDKMPPVPAEIAIYNQDAPDNCQVVKLVKKGTVYVPKPADALVINDTVNVSPGLTGIGMNVDDYMDGSDNTIAFYTAMLYVDDSLQSQVTLDDIGYDETRYVNAYTDYRLKKEAHKWIQRLYKLPGNHLDHIYSNMNVANGKVYFKPGSVHKITVVVTDDKNNKTTIAFYSRAGLQTKSDHGEVKKGLHFTVNRPNVFVDSDVVFTLDSRALYEDVWLKCERSKTETGYSDKLKIGDAATPVHNYFDLHLKPNRTIPAALSNKVVMRYSDGESEDGRAAVRIDSGWYRSRVRNLGTYWLAIDTTAPVIKSLQKNNSNLGRAKQIAFEVKDELTTVKSFGGYLDGKWICFEQHNDIFFYKFDEHCPRGKHQLVFDAEDESGNKQVYHLNFTR